jgi:hypothetical protein
MAIGKLWAGRIYGTNIGNVFVKLTGEDAALTGIARLNDETHGVAVYELRGSFDGTNIALVGKPKDPPDNVMMGEVSVTGKLNAQGSLRGEWSSTLGTGGTVVLHRHDSADEQEPSSVADQLHIKRHKFGAVALKRVDILKLADKMQSQFQSNVIVTVTAATSQSRTLPDFKKTELPYPTAEAIKLYVQQHEQGGINRILQLEFSEAGNTIEAQSVDESWALGIVEKMRMEVRLFEHSYATHIRRLGFGINQVFAFWTLVFIPSITDLWWRAGFLLAMIAIVWVNNELHRRFLPTATIELGESPPSLISRIGPRVVSWLIASASTIAVTLVSAYVGGILKLTPLT